jgi:hypothetical protein
LFWQSATTVPVIPNNFLADFTSVNVLFLAVRKAPLFFLVYDKFFFLMAAPPPLFARQRFCFCCGVEL